MNNQISTKSSGLGEGPLWHQDRFYWVDIVSGELNTLSKGVQSCLFKSEQGLTAAVVHSEGGFVLSLDQRIVHLDKEETLTLGEDFNLNDETLRFNDGKCDPRGRFWVGSMDCGESDFSGSLYVLDKGVVKKVLDGLCISNGLCWNDDCSQFYFIDSATQTVEAFDLDSETLELTNRRSVYKIPEKDVYPDGMCIDAEGNLWVALWNGHGVICIDVAKGEVIHKLSIPCRKATSCCFGGENLDELYVTSDARGEDLQEYPLSGHVFKFKLDVNGLPATAYQG